MTKEGRSKPAPEQEAHPENPGSPSKIKNTFRKCERISGKRLFEHLMSEGRFFNSGILKVTFSDRLPEGLATSHLMVAFSVPKRNFKRAVDRNFLKRRLREAWRMNKSELVAVLKEKGKHMTVLVKYDARKRMKSAAILPEVINVLNKLKERA